QRQASDQVSIGNSIGSLRFVESHDWATWVESVSVVERVLRNDPAGVYAEQDFKSRDRYRHVVEKIARRSPYTELQVAELAVGLARDSGGQASPSAANGTLTVDVRREHVGHYLVGGGRPLLDRAAGMRPTLRQRLGRLCNAAPVFLLVAGVVLPAVLGTSLVLWHSWQTGMAIAFAAILVLSVFVAATQPAVGLVNWLITKLAEPRRLPRLRFEDGIPAEAKTAVVVPAMLSSVEQFDDLVASMEIRFLGNGDPNVTFVLLTDFPDAEAETLDTDDALLDHARTAVDQLNQRYDFETGEKFMLLHRPRLWNESEGVWMGRERKRGKLDDFNKLLTSPGRDGDPAMRAFSTSIAARERLYDVEYVIVLDSDTQLPRDTARQLVGVMHHPLNRPAYDDKLGRVIDGYGILQPRVDVNLVDAHESFFSRLAAGDVGIDPYTHAVSDVYQDAFGEGSFVGKGIYHAATFEKACGGRFRDNQILSHDLIESAFARSGLAGDVVLYEDTPSSYVADVARRQRWVRGDWQLVSHLLPWHKTADGRACGTTLSNLSRWKLLDNLRRSLVPIAMLFTLLIAAVAVPGDFWAWALLAVGFYFVPPICTWLAGVVGELFATEAEESLAGRLREGVHGLMPDLVRSSMNLVLLPYEAWIHSVAIVKTGWRLLVTRKHLLEWRTAAEAERLARRDHASYWEAMWPGWLIAVALVGGLFAFAAETSAVVAAVALALPWIASPTLAFLISRPTRQKPLDKQLAARDQRFLRKVTRRTWSFFDRYVAAADHYLPPDNVQEVPEERIAPRTSPTNIGLGLLSHLAAHDFGYVTLGQLLDRVGRMLESSKRLERHESGHFFNWYDTRRLAPLEPRYVSAVDSGNFVASLHVLSRGVRQLVHESPIRREQWNGIADTIRLFLDTCRGLERVRLLEDQGEAPPEPRVVALPESLERRLEQLASECSGEVGSAGPAKLSGAKLLLQKLSVAAAEAVEATRNAPDEHRRWATELERHVGRFAEELHHLCPWVDLVGPARPYQPGDSVSRDRLVLIESSLAALESYPSLRYVADLRNEVIPAAVALADEVDTATLRPHADLPYFKRLVRILSDAADRAASRIDTLKGLADTADDLAKADWSLMFDRGRRLLHIGYNASDRRLDAGHYDLLASEMRLGSFALVASGDLPQEHWFALGRQVTRAGGHATLLSWSGSMFEYLMP
ncbi:MAG: glycosyltransferase family 2 protein, partial [Planctomycetota bacterium]